MKDEYMRRLILCINRIDGKYYDMAKNCFIGENEVAVLYSLSDGCEHSQKSICDEWLIPKTTINSVIHKMLKEGYVQITSLAGREKMLALTQDGKDYAKKILIPLRKAESYALDKTLEAFGPSFIDAMEAFTKYLEQYNELNNDNG